MPNSWSVDERPRRRTHRLVGLAAKSVHVNSGTGDQKAGEKDISITSSSHDTKGSMASPTMPDGSHLPDTRAELRKMLAAQDPARVTCDHCNRNWVPTPKKGAGTARAMRWSRPRHGDRPRRRCIEWFGGWTGDSGGPWGCSRSKGLRGRSIQGWAR